MNRRIRGVASLLSTSALALVLGCAGTEPAPRAPPQLTSAELPATVNELYLAKEAAAKLQSERDAALRQAQDERLRREDEERATQERARFEQEVRLDLAPIDQELHRVLVQAGCASARTKAKVEHIARMREELEGRLRRLHTEPAAAWVQFKVETHVAIDDLRRALSGALGR